MKYLRRGNDVDFIETTDLAVTDQLAIGTYQLRFSDMRGYYLEIVPNYQVKQRLYGNAQEIADMIFNGFVTRKASTGALLHGYKGTGKTNIARLIAEAAIDNHTPVVVISEQFEGADFMSVFNKLPECVIIFDEFEKTYGRHEQQGLLSLFDGMNSTKFLFLLTVNNYFALDEHLINRPGRLLYSIEMHGLTKEVIQEYIDINLEHPDLADSVLRAFSAFGGVTFDMVKGVVDEVNRTARPATELLEYLNIDITGDKYVQYTAKIVKGTKDYPNNVLLDDNPLGKKRVDIWFEEKTKDGCEYHEFTLDLSNFTDIKGENIVFNKDGYTVSFSPVISKAFHPDAV